MIRAGIIDDGLIGPVRVPQGIKVTFAVYCQFLKNVLDTINAIKERYLHATRMTMHNTHAAKVTLYSWRGFVLRTKNVNG